MSASHPVQRLAIQRQPRLLFASFNGTWAGGVLGSRKTAVSILPRLISDHENVVEIRVNGVGSDISRVDRLLGGLSGWGTLRNVITAYRNIANHYQAGDRIILCGYSRGAWAARYLALIINLIGLPKDADEKFFHLLYKSCDDDSIFDEDVIAKILDNHQRWPDVEIDALCCFDTVGSLGLPLFAIAKSISVLRRRRDRVDRVSEVANNIRYSFHCLSLHETRRPFGPTYMRGSNVHQVFFPGNHGDMGWVDDSESFVHAPFAWMIQQLNSHLDINFDEARLAARLPSYSTGATASLLQPHQASNTSPRPIAEPIYAWCTVRISHASRSLLAVIGRKPRHPGRIVACGTTSCVHRRLNHDRGNRPQTGYESSTSRGSLHTVSDDQIHVGARIRAHRLGVDVVPGYMIGVPVAGDFHWALRRGNLDGPQRPQHNQSDTTFVESGISSRQTRTSAAGCRSVIADRIEEAPIGPLEASLLGLPASLASLPTCCGIARPPTDDPEEVNQSTPPQEPRWFIQILRHYHGG